MITSLSNPVIKHLTKLSRKGRYRKQTQLFLVEGQKEIQYALEGGYICEGIYSKEGVEEHAWVPKDISITILGNKVYEQITYRSKTEGFVGVFRIPSGQLQNWTVPPQGVFVILDHVEKPGNIGAILRTCDAFGLQGLILCGGGDPYSPNTIRSSVGCVFHVPIVESDYEDIVEWLQLNNINLYVSHLDSTSKNYRDIPYNKPAALVLGSESTGVLHHWKMEQTLFVKIPMKGRNDSLNVSVAGALLINEICRP